MIAQRDYRRLNISGPSVELPPYESNGGTETVCDRIKVNVEENPKGYLDMLNITYAILHGLPVGTRTY